MVNFQQKECYNLNDLKEIVALLRQPGGCPWDREQTHKSLRRNLIEESCEVVEAINEGDTEHLREELGDVLLQVLFHTDIERDAGRFDLDDVADGVCKKLIFRHPHVFGEVSVKDSQQVLTNWEALKRQEKHQETYTDTLTSVSKALPALWRAEKVQKKAKKAGFDWNSVSGAMDKLSEELGELQQAVAETSPVHISEELGDLLFAAVNVARFVDADPEETLNAATEKFIARFARVEALAKEQGRDMGEMTLTELDALWERAKHPCA